MRTRSNAMPRLRTVQEVVVEEEEGLVEEQQVVVNTKSKNAAEPYQFIGTI
jgi:hypothetical protein